MLSRWFLFIHIFSAITFFLAHGAGAAMAFQIRKETNLERIRAMLDLSGSTIGLYMLAFMLLLVTGVTSSFLLGLWNRIWLWTSLVLMLGVFFWMYWFSERTYKVLRKLVGLPYMLGNKSYPAEEPASSETIAAHIKGIDIHQLVIGGYLVPGFVLWLMVFKPF
jgi:hypothetical protein